MKKNLHRIEVSSYSGYKAEEKPMFFSYRGVKYEISQILDMCFEESSSNRTRKRSFRVQCKDSSIQKIYYDIEKNVWYLEAFQND